ncbi:hypothetical protein CONCODRAFT_2956 [Conidiobolus coronatus NRRL 28638]|uniref:Mitochondrial import inner membrane translocase subunit n=1 Tax=Conidiobolus coronatus (strain ATCC 28846 / CBS 209.66 / NRRL 28638) TaxID=796925 RepID=A0A137PGD1_CONC2|nr:hypothetical protein CONCODRAFT_2956 [Conidiobolus coronatus NRRL 28638]|eukprot:KXN74063.1 hypothetical protein CONCODRAFT_2956 [Conidiobolus coronatus NRRL 28638]
MDALETEFSIMNDLFQKISTTCRQKCIQPQYHEPDVTKGEAVCIDRCVAKYFAVSQNVAKMMREKQMNL